MPLFTQMMPRWRQILVATKLCGDYSVVNRFVTVRFLFLMPQRLLFIYNADTGLLPGLKDLFHKILAPATYPCSLCAVTYGATSMRPEWQQFIRQLAVPVEFLHRDEFGRAYPQWRTHPLPAAFAVDDAGALTPFIDAPEMDATDLNGLMQLVRERL